jgi:uncharacterized UPF0160 family protein
MTSLISFVKRLFIIFRCLPKFKDAEVIRTRDPQVIEQGTVVVDVGGEYVPESLRFDHHQRSFTDTFSPNHLTRLSSAGLVYKHFGKEVIAQILKVEESHPNVELLYWKIYEEFIEGVCSLIFLPRKYFSEVDHSCFLN